MSWESSCLGKHLDVIIGATIVAILDDLGQEWHVLNDDLFELCLSTFIHEHLGPKLSIHLHGMASVLEDLARTFQADTCS